jgi:hypothetical protein
MVLSSLGTFQQMFLHRVAAAIGFAALGINKYTLASVAWPMQQEKRKYELHNAISLRNGNIPLQHRAHTPAQNGKAVSRSSRSSISPWFIRPIVAKSKMAAASPARSSRKRLKKQCIRSSILPMKLRPEACCMYQMRRLSHKQQWSAVEHGVPPARIQTDIRCARERSLAKSARRIGLPS